MKCTHLRHCDVAAHACPGRPRDAYEMATARNRSLITAGDSTHREDYTSYKYVLNLPGSTSGSYSRNLNHLWSLDSVVISKVMKRGTRAKSYGPGCRLILEHLSERCAANCLMGKTSNASRCSAYNDPSFDCGSRRCADACLRRDDATGRIECLNEMHVKNNSAAKCLLPREGVATRWCGVATPAPSPRPPSRPTKKHESIWNSLFG